MEGIDPDYADFLRGLFRTALLESNLSTFRRHAPKGATGSADMEGYLKAAIESLKRRGAKGEPVQQRKRPLRRHSTKSAYDEGVRIAVEAAKKYDTEISKIK